MTTIEKAAHGARAQRPFHFLHAILNLLSVARSRRSLLRLDDHMLRDIGLTRHEAEAEATRAPWDAPMHWRC